MRILTRTPNRIARWKEIGWEVFERKALLLAATRDLEQNKVADAMKLAATDIFVEKAQRFLTSRGRWLYAFGAFTSVAAMLVLLGGAYFVYTRDPLRLLNVASSAHNVSTAYLTVLVLKSTTAGAFLGAVAFFLVSLSRALLHEATVLFSRRHSLRFGRLFVYLMSDKMTRKDLEVIFNWHAEFSTAFKDIRAEQITKSPLNKLIDTPVEILKAARALAKNECKTRSEEGDSEE